MTKKKNRVILLITTAVCLIAAIVVVVLNNRPQKQENNTAEEDLQAVNTVDDTKAEETDQLVIPLSEITETAKFYPVTIDGTNMEVLAVKASDGSIRTAFNTCQSCYTSGKGYYKTEGTDLVCQNCGFHFTADQVGLSTGGCSPWAIMDSDREQTEDAIIISYDFLKSSKAIFANWSK